MMLRCDSLEAGVRRAELSFLDRHMMFLGHADHEVVALGELTESQAQLFNLPAARPLLFPGGRRKLVKEK